MIRGANARKLIEREHLKLMKPGSVIMDVSIDRRECSESSRPTTHGNPFYVVAHVIHCCVTNMHGAYARSPSFVVNNYTIKYGLKLANRTVEKACKENPALMKGLNLYKGSITFKSVADAFGLESFYRPVEESMNS